MSLGSLRRELWDDDLKPKLAELSRQAWVCACQLYTFARGPHDRKQSRWERTGRIAGSSALGLFMLWVVFVFVVGVVGFLFGIPEMLHTLRAAW